MARRSCDGQLDRFCGCRQRLHDGAHGRMLVIGGMQGVSSRSAEEDDHVASQNLLVLFPAGLEGFGSNSGGNGRHVATLLSCVLPMILLLDSSIAKRLQRFLAELRERFAKFGLGLHPEKTRLIEFGRHADKDRRARGEGKPESFNFLGFTHLCGKNRKGYFTVMRQTMRKRWQAKIQTVRTELRRRLHDPIPKVGTYLRAVVTGHARYYGVPTNSRALGAFRLATARVWLWVLRRRSQKSRLPWSRFAKCVRRWLPQPRICHPYPSVRFAVTTQGRSRVR